MMAHFISAIELEAKRRGCFLLVSSHINPDPENPTYARMLASRHVDGIIFSRLGEPQQEKRYLQDLLAQNIPLVALGDWPEAQGLVSSVGLDEFDGGYRATRYLLDLEHRQIGLITGPMENSAALSRRSGYEQALKDFGIPLDPSLIVEGDWTFGSGFQAAITLLQRHPGLTALFCQNDRMAIAAMQAVQQSGRHVPQDVSIIGFDDIPDAAYANPALTTMRQSAEDIGEVAARLLFEKIENPSVPNQRIELKATLVKRDSCALRSR